MSRGNYWKGPEPTAGALVRCIDAFHWRADPPLRMNAIYRVVRVVRGHFSSGPGVVLEGVTNCLHESNAFELRRFVIAPEEWDE